MPSEYFKIYDTVNNFLLLAGRCHGCSILKQNKNFKALNRQSNYGVIQMSALSVKPSSQAYYTHMKIAFFTPKEKNSHMCTHTHKSDKKINRISKINNITFPHFKHKSLEICSHCKSRSLFPC